jgi:hypothetical protein
MTLPSLNGKVYGRKDAVGQKYPTATAVSQLSNDSGFITADNKQGLLLLPDSNKLQVKRHFLKILL